MSEFVAGPSLQERVRTGGPLREGDLDRLAVGTASALAAIHAARVVHRDFKPANVLLGPDGPRVVDFGIARPLDAETGTSALAGTPPYMAPEQLGGAPASPAADVFAWASTMAYAATGRAPFGNDTVAAVFNRILHQDPDLTGVPPGLLPVLAGCLAKDPRSRPSARSLLIRLVDPGSPTVTVADVGPVPTAYLPPDWHRPAAQDTGPGTRADVAPASFTTQPGTGPAAKEGRPGRAARVAMAVAVAAAAATIGVLYATGTIGGTASGDGTTGQVTGGATNRTAGDEASRAPGAAEGESAPETGGAEAPAGAVRVPPAFAGTWTGRIVSADEREETRDVAITLTAGESTATMVIGDCEHQATPTRTRGPNVLELTVAQVGQCVGGDATLTLGPSGTMEFAGQEGASALEYRGTLRRS
ncbi:protein kinase domain-containing protein [Thermocatellispora tengchongensis]|uniref:protein kinase domain-containing protein n=1 Tax=Thermocatellispora tengchongensis TaxID=1073253 RepID=UPI003625D23F